MPERRILERDMPERGPSEHEGDPTHRSRTLALGRRSALFYRSIARALFAFGEITYRSEKRFVTRGQLLRYVRRSGFDQVLMPNPYGNPRRMRCYRWLRSAGVRVIACDRGALPESWFFDEAFLADSASYDAERWDHPLTEPDQESVRSYIARLRDSNEALEEQGPRCSQDTLRRSLDIGEGRVLFVPWQRPADTAVRFFAAGLSGMDGFAGFVRRVAEELERIGEPWTILVKRHPLEDELTDFDSSDLERLRIRIVPPDLHVHDLLDLADACLVLTSGVGVLSLAFGTPTFHAGRAFYGGPGLSRYVASAREAATRIAESAPVDEERVERFLHHLRRRVYSFGPSTTKVVRSGSSSKAKSGPRRRATLRIRFDTLCVLGRSVRLPRAHVLVLTPVVPWPIDRGSQARLDTMTRRLIEQGYLVSLCAMDDHPRRSPEEAERALRHRYPEAHRIAVHPHPGQGLRRLGREARRAIDLVTGGVHRISNLETCPPGFRALVRQICEETDPTHLLVNYAKLTPAIPDGFDGVSIVDTHDCQTRLVEESQRHSGTRRLVSVPHHRESERRALARYDRIVAINPDEAKTFAKWAPRAEVHFIPHFTPPTPLPPITADEAEFDTIFIGGGSSFNVLALRWLLEDVLPLVRQELPDFRLGAIGRMTQSSRIEPHLRARATLLGPVDDLARVYEKTHSVVAPLRGGAGMKTKVVEALGYRRPVVCTPVAAHGIRLEHRKSAWIAESAAGLAEGLIALRLDPSLGETLASGGLALHAKEHSPTAVGPTIDALLSPSSQAKR